MPAAFGGSGQPGAQRTAALGESGQLLSAQRSLSKTPRRWRFAPPRRLVGRWLPNNGDAPCRPPFRAAALSEAGFRLPQLPFIDPH